MTNFGPMLSLGALAAVSFGVYSIGRGVLMSPRLSSVTGFVNNLPMDAQNPIECWSNRWIRSSNF